METQTWLSRHYKFISAENITILPVSSDEFLHAFLPQNIKIEEIAEKLNKAEPSIKYTYEKEANNKIPFPDILILNPK